MNTQIRAADTDVLEYQQTIIEEKKVSKLVVFNDDINTFDHVIRTLMEVCHHDALRAEQCTLIIHYKGKCTVESGEYEELVPMRQAICDRGISAEVYTD